MFISLQSSSLYLLEYCCVFSVLLPPVDQWNSVITPIGRTVSLTVSIMDLLINVFKQNSKHKLIFQLLKCENLLLLSVIFHCKWNISKQTIYINCHGNVLQFFGHFLD